MILRSLIALCTAVAVVWSAGPALAASPASGSPAQNPSPQSSTVQAPAPTKPKSKPRRVIIFGTTIVGDVLTPPIEKTVPWQRPADFRADSAPLTHDFTTELLTPLDRNAILREAGENDH
jgi:hypothetical protein